MIQAWYGDRVGCGLRRGCAVGLMLCRLTLNAEARPDKFPEVRLIAESSPRYAALSFDAWAETEVYLLFDGNLEQGYNRLYVWIPGDRQYGTPVALTAAADRTFAPLLRRVNGGEDEASEVVWNLRWGYGATGGTGVSYLTGETVTREIRRHANFGFNLNYIRERRSVRGQRLEITIPGSLPTVTAWQDLPRGLAPWNALRVNVQVNQQPVSDQITLRLTARLLHADRTCPVLSMPDPFFKINLSVAPYMQAALFETEQQFQDLLQTGASVTVDPRWYSIAWDYQLPEWLGARSGHGSHFMPVARRP